MKRSAIKRTRKQTGPDAATRNLVYGRDGMACCLCGGTFMLQIHHRAPRKAGGTSRPEINSPANLLLLDQPCHELIESQRALARSRGFLVPAGFDPACVPVMHQGAWKWLCPDGTAVPLGSAELADLDGGAA